MSTLEVSAVLTVRWTHLVVRLWWRAAEGRDLHRCWAEGCHRCQSPHWAPTPGCTRLEAAQRPRSEGPWCGPPPASPRLRSHSLCTERNAGRTPLPCPVLFACAFPPQSPPAAPHLLPGAGGWRAAAAGPGWVHWTECFQVSAGMMSRYETQSCYWSLDFHCTEPRCWIQRRPWCPQSAGWPPLCPEPPSGGAGSRGWLRLRSWTVDEGTAPPGLCWTRPLCCGFHLTHCGRMENVEKVLYSCQMYCLQTVIK